MAKRKRERAAGADAPRGSAVDPDVGAAPAETNGNSPPEEPSRGVPAGVAAAIAVALAAGLVATVFTFRAAEHLRAASGASGDTAAAELDAAAGYRFPGNRPAGEAIRRLVAEAERRERAGDPPGALRVARRVASVTASLRGPGEPFRAERDRARAAISRLSGSEAGRRSADVPLAAGSAVGASALLAIGASFAAFLGRRRGVIALAAAAWVIFWGLSFAL